MRRLALGAIGFCAACQSSLYDWGNYDESVAAMYATSGGYDPARQVAQLTEWIEQTEHRGARVPPGARAHVGFLLIEAGNAERGAAYLNAEKNAYPESAVFIDGLLARAARREQ